MLTDEGEAVNHLYEVKTTYLPGPNRTKWMNYRERSARISKLGYGIAVLSEGTVMASSLFFLKSG